MDSEWLKAEFARTGKQKSDLAARLGKAPSAVTAMLDGKRKVQLKEAPIIKAFFSEGLPLSDDLREAKEGQSESENGLALSAVQESVLAYLKVIGEVAGGVWVEPGVRSDEELTTIPINPRWPAESTYLLRVKGNSINRKARDGDLVVCLDAWAAPRSAMPGDWVVVERARNGLIETTVKQVGEGRHGYVLKPCSDDPLFQEAFPIGDLDGDTFTVRAFVLRFVREATIF